MIRNVHRICRERKKNLEDSSVDQRIILSGILKLECECEHWIYWLSTGLSASLLSIMG
jgi:hypothetical protein